MVPMNEERRPTNGEEIANSLSHGAGLALAIAGTPVLIVAAMRYGSAWNTIGVSVFAASMISLYLASTLYHALTHDRAKRDRKSTRLNSSHSQISYAVFCLKKKKKTLTEVVSSAHLALTYIP